MDGFCAISFALIGSTVLTMIMNKKYTDTFVNSLDNQQKTIYKEIQQERFMIFKVATAFAIIIGLFNIRHSTSSCYSVASALTTQTYVYLIWPKTKYMLDYIKTPEQSSLWMRNYRHMSYSGTVGTIIGLILYFTFKFNK